MTRSRKLRQWLLGGCVMLVLLMTAGPGAVLGREAIAAETMASGWSNFYYWNVAGTTLRPRDSSLDWDNDGIGGCLFQTAGSTGEIFNIHLDLPPGSRVDYLRLFYYDTSGATSSAWVTSYNNAGGLVDRTSVTSSGSAGYATLSPYLGHVVDTFNNSYVLNWRSNQLGNSMRLCGLRVAYRISVAYTFLPVVMKNA
ncbi:MAG: hypothetical protein JXB35_02045 [Anaerolineae bacterium]|nr:hypothetical protein [Anaerolineae bacterium]